MNKKQTIIISGFPGIGKSHLYDRGWDALDSDSSHFSWVKDSEGKNTKERHPDFPNNYMEHIKNNLGKYYYIFVECVAYTFPNALLLEAYRFYPKIKNLYILQLSVQFVAFLDLQ